MTFMSVLSGDISKFTNAFNDISSDLSCHVISELGKFDLTKWEDRTEDESESNDEEEIIVEARVGEGPTAPMM